MATIQKLLNELFSLDEVRNKNILSDYVDENNVNFRWKEM